MSGMKLRQSIRVPVRYGEDESETPTRNFLRPGTEELCDEESMELGEPGRVRSHKKRKPTLVQYNPGLPPAVFPSLNRPHSGLRVSTPDPKSRVNNNQEVRRASGVKSVPQSCPIRQTAQPKAVSFDPSESESVPINQLENHLASNNMDNSTYARNVELACIPRPDAPLIPDDMTTCLDSDDDQLPDATQMLLEKIPNPAWNDLNPAMQVEIFENMMKDYNYWGLCRVLGLGKKEREKIEEYVGVRNKQILRENNHLEQMRQKQRKALMNIDNSDLKLFEPPPQLVLKKITRDTTRRLVNKYTNLMMCQAHDFLKARQYLHQRGLPRRYAGDWGDSLVVLNKSEEDGPPEPDPPEPDKFEWEEELRFTPPPPAVDPARVQALQDTVDSINRMGRDAIAPGVLVRRSTDQEPILDWGKYYEKQKDGLWWDTTKLRDGGMVKLNIGSQRAAAIGRYEKTGTMPRSVMPKGTVFQGPMPRGAMSRGSAPRFGMHQGDMPQGAMPQGATPQPFILRGVTPQSTYPQGTYPQGTYPQGTYPQCTYPQGTYHQDTHSPGIYPQGTYPQHFRPQRMAPRGQMSEPALHSSLPLEAAMETPSRMMHNGAPSGGVGIGSSPGFPLPFEQQRARPISRVLPGDNYSRPWDHTDSQARFERHLARASLEHVEAEAKAQAEWFNPLPIHRVSGVGAGSSLFRRPPQKLTETVEETLPSEPFSWEDHEQAMCANIDDDEWFRQFIYSDPPSEPKEERSEQIKQAEEEMEEVTERHATQTTANDLSSNTDISIDDVMLVPTDGECSSP